MGKELKDVIHFYLGCDIEINVYGKDRVATLMGIDPQYYHLKMPGDMAPTTYFNGKYVIKPILRQLSDITEEELRELICLRYFENRDIFEQTLGRIERREEYKMTTRFGTSIPFSTFDKEGKHQMTGTFSSSSLNPYQLQYLFKQGFDLFGLLESGQAISPTNK